MNIKEMIPALEAVLFASGEPMPIDRICSVFVIDIETANEALKALDESLNERNSGLKLAKLGANYQLCTKHEYAEYIKEQVLALEIIENPSIQDASVEELGGDKVNFDVKKVA